MLRRCEGQSEDYLLDLCDNLSWKVTHVSYHQDINITQLDLYTRVQCWSINLKGWGSHHVVRMSISSFFIMACTKYLCIPFPRVNMWWSDADQNCHVQRKENLFFSSLCLEKINHPSCHVLQTFSIDTNYIFLKIPVSVTLFLLKKNGIRSKVRFPFYTCSGPNPSQANMP